MTVLETPRLRLRPFCEGDIDAFCSYRSDPLVARYQGWDAPYPRGKAAAFITRMAAALPGTPGGWYQWAVERKAAPGLIGDCTFYLSESEPQQAEIGFTLALAWQRQGYAHEAACRLLEYLFSQLHLHRVTAVCDDANYPSIAVLERLGLRREAHLIENVWFKGAWGSEYHYAILEREWFARQLGS